MIWLMSYAASALRILASKLDGMETVQINHVNVQNDIHVYTMVDATPEQIAEQIKFHMGLHAIK
jgi:bisphosphoglycerate-dependent phosphoglycerate mutase